MHFLFLPVYSYLATKFDAIDSLSGKELIVESKSNSPKFSETSVFPQKLLTRKFLLRILSIEKK